MKEKLECGCTHDGANFTSMCLNHKLESDRLHAIWAAEYYRDAGKGFVPIPEYLALVERGQAMLH